jgi:catechol 2,3-dioxygenase-like lactoylglutathione lyase family enzyme
MVTSNEVHHVTICVKDLDESLSFYRDLLGLEIWAEFNEGSFSSKKELGSYLGSGGEPQIRSVILQKGELVSGMVELFQWLTPSGKTVNKSTGMYERGMWVLAFTTTDIEQMYNKLSENGIEFITDLTSLDAGGFGKVRGFFCLDPDGVVVEFVEYP